MASPTNPFLDPQAFDVVKIAGVECPGICVLTGFARSAEWDIKKGRGTKGGTATLSQLPPSKGSIEFSLWTDAQFEFWNTTYRKLFIVDPTRKGGSAMDIYHPALAEIGVHSVVVEEIGALEHKGKGLYSITVKVIEYLPPPKKTITSTPSGSKSGGNKSGKSGSADDPIADAKQREIARLLEEARAA